MMTAIPFDTGIVTVSLDTELGWARIDTGEFDNIADRLEEGRRAIERLLALFERHDMPATWAVVGQLCRDDTGPGTPLTDVNPTADGARIPWDRDWWHAREAVERIVKSPVDHEIGSHSGNHLRFDACDVASARRDLEAFFEWCDLVERSSVRSFVYPGNRIDHTDVLAETGFECYRGHPPLLGVEPTPTAFLPKRAESLVTVPTSVSYRHYGGRHALLRAFPDRLKTIGLRAGIEHAARRGRVFHVVLHPNDFTLADGKKLLNGLDRWLSSVATARDRGRIQTLTMGEVASRARFE